MGKIIEQKLNRFAGITDDIRSGKLEYWQMLKHFDISSNPYKATPFGGSQADTTGQTGIGNIIVRNDGVLIGLGTSGSNQNLFKKSTASDPTSAWTAFSGNTGLSGQTVDYRLFVEYIYGSTKRIYTASQSRYIGRYDSAESASVAPTYSDLTAFTNICQGVVHPKDNILYVGYDNKIWLDNAGTPTVTALTLPADRKIVSLAPYGNLLAIATVPITGGTIARNAIVYLWDRDSSVTTLYDSLDWGNGELKAINNLNGVLVGVSVVGLTVYNRNKASIQIKAYDGSKVVLIKEIPCAVVSMPGGVGNTASPTPLNFVNADKWYFSAKYYQSGGGAQTTTEVGVFAVFKSKVTGRYEVCIERVATTDNTEYSNGILSGAVVQDYFSAVYNAVGTLSITPSSNTDYTNTSVAETSIINGGDSRLVKKLIGVSVQTEAMPAAGSISLYYMKDEETSWTLIFTNTTDNDLNHDAVNIESSGALIPEFREIRFKVTSTGGAAITGISYKLELIDKNKY